jgi:hypothetical protein
MNNTIVINTIELSDLEPNAVIVCYSLDPQRTGDSGAEASAFTIFESIARNESFAWKVDIKKVRAAKTIYLAENVGNRIRHIRAKATIVGADASTPDMVKFQYELRGLDPESIRDDSGRTGYERNKGRKIIYFKDVEYINTYFVSPNMSGVVFYT